MCVCVCLYVYYLTASVNLSETIYFPPDLGTHPENVVWDSGNFPWCWFLFHWCFPKGKTRYLMHLDISVGAAIAWVTMNKTSAFFKIPSWVTYTLKWCLHIKMNRWYILKIFDRKDFGETQGCANPSSSILEIHHNH